LLSANSSQSIDRFAAATAEISIATENAANKSPVAMIDNAGLYVKYIPVTGVFAVESNVTSPERKRSEICP